jgi:phospholipase C
MKQLHAVALFSCTLGAACTGTAGSSTSSSSSSGSAVSSSSSPAASSSASMSASSAATSAGASASSASPGSSSTVASSSSLPASSSAAASSSSGGGTHIQTVFLILLENKNWSDILGSSHAPWINGTLLPMASSCSNYKGAGSAVHPSEPNYLWLEAGDNFGVTNDNAPSSNHQATTEHLVTQLRTAGVSWKSYQEDITGTTCPTTSHALYNPKHNPNVFFDDVTNDNTYCVSHNRPYTELATDLAANTVARFNFITPNLCNDMHGDVTCLLQDNIAVGDTWLQTAVQAIMASQAYQNGGAIFITWDESEGPNPFSNTSDNPIGMIVVSPLAKGNGYVSSVDLRHGSTLRSMQEIFGVTPLLRAAATSTNLADLFTAFP